MEIAAIRSASADTLLIGESAAMREVRLLIRQVAPTTASVLVTGPSGSGKEMVARAIHLESQRAAKPFIAVNCAAIARDLLESELFGHEKGAFTGAVSQRRGRFEEAQGGTLFLDEIGDMPLDMQAKILRAIEQRAVQRVGGRGEITVDNRIVSATHRDLRSAITEQRFREDLYYRLAVFPIHLPPLAERREDIPLLVRAFLRRKTDVKFTPAGMDRLVAHDWAGNVRELRNVAERASILFPGRTIGAEQVDSILQPGASGEPPAHGARNIQIRLATALNACTEETVPPAVSAGDPARSLRSGPVDLRAIMADMERQYICEALKLAGGVVAEAARALSLQRTTLIEKMRKYGLDREAA